MRYIPLILLALLLLPSVGCGVKGNPTPYIETYPEKKPADPIPAKKAEEGKPR